MTRLALLCSGQGFQHPGMFALTSESEAAAPVFAAAERALGGCDPCRIVADDQKAMHDNVIAQILCCTQALAAARLLEDALKDEDVVVAGYSVGELAAWGVAGVFDAQTLMHLAERRAAAMDAAAAKTAGGLAAIRGLPRRRIDELCREHAVHVAIVNGAEQIVVGGARDALASALDTARTAGADKITRLAVGVPSHTPLLADAVEPFGTALREERANDLPTNRRLVSGIDGDTVVSIDDGLDKLARQLAQTIEWQACMDTCSAAGATRALELGPGGALAKLMADRLGARDSRSIEDFRSLDGVRRWLETR